MFKLIQIVYYSGIGALFCDRVSQNTGEMLTELRCQTSLHSTQLGQVFWSSGKEKHSQQHGGGHREVLCAFLVDYIISII